MWKANSSGVLIKIELSKIIKINPKVSGQNFTYFIGIEEFRKNPTYFLVLYYKMYSAWKAECNHEP